MKKTRIVAALALAAVLVGGSPALAGPFTEGGATTQASPCCKN